MAVVEVKNIAGDRVSERELVDEIFNVPVKKSVLHEVVRMQRASRRSGTASVRRRSDVAGSTAKLFRQKGTGRARAGDIKSPLRRGGGVTFGPEPRSYAFNIPKKKRRLALKMALSSKLMDNELIVLDKIDLDEIKTRTMVNILNGLDMKKPLIIIPAKDKKLELSARNIPGVKILYVAGLNVYDILDHHNLVLLEGAIEGIEGRLAA
ncbi:MAG: 50S ribosomal protein L4 [Deltaproteobacteria bacterium]|nr:50S ribosomal protein L4 [Deltaproteobacteria bacterium]